MKRAAIRHPKSRRLARELGIPLPHALGILTMLWDFVGEFAPEGNVGRFADDEIAEACSWPEDDAERLVAVLKETGWIDGHPEHRLVIHDWGDHCEDWVKKRLRRAERDVVSGASLYLGQRGELPSGQRPDTGKPPSGQRPDTGEPPSDVPPHPRQPARPSPAQPSPAKPSPAKPAASSLSKGDGDDSRAPADGGDGAVTKAGTDKVVEGMKKIGQRPGSKQPEKEKFKQLLELRVCNSIGLQGDDAGQQKAAIRAVGERAFVGEFGPPAAASDRIVAIAEDVARAPNVRNPMAVWQKRVNELEESGKRAEANVVER